MFPSFFTKLRVQAQYPQFLKRELGVKNFVVNFSSHKWLYLTYVRCKHGKAWSINQAKTKLVNSLKTFTFSSCTFDSNLFTIRNLTSGFKFSFVYLYPISVDNKFFIVKISR